MLERLGSEKAASGGLRPEARSCAQRARFRDQRGSAVLEFAFVFPLLLTVLLGIIYFGIALSGYITLANAAAMGAQALSISRGQTADVCQTTGQAILNGASNLNSTNLKVTIYVGVTSLPPTGTALISNATPPLSCSSGQASLAAAQGKGAYVQVTYPANLTFFGYNGGSFNLTAQSTVAIQ